MPVLIRCPDYQLAVSVLTNIYDTKADYVDIMWRMLTNGGIGLLDNLPIASKINVAELTRTLRREGYVIEIKNAHQLLPDRIIHSKPPATQPVPQNERFVYRKALEQLQNEQSKPSKEHAVPVTGIAFRKVDGKGNLGRRIRELTQRQ